MPSEGGSKNFHSRIVWCRVVELTYPTKTKSDGLADGKSFRDYQIAIQADYSKMNDLPMATKANLNGLRELLKQWQVDCLLNSDLLQAVKEAHKS